MTTELIAWEDWKVSEIQFQLCMRGYNIDKENIKKLAEQLNNAKDIIVVAINEFHKELREAIDQLAESLKPFINQMVDAIKAFTDILDECYDKDESVFMDNIERNSRTVRYKEFMKQESYYDNCFKIAKANYNRTHKKLC